MNHQGDFLEFRGRYPRFFYHSYTIIETATEFQITYHFSIEGLSDFSPTWRFPKGTGTTLSGTDPIVQNLAFSLGLVELVSYWKIACPPQVKILCGGLSEEQKIWWKKQYFSGLGEFFYKNEIQTNFECFMSIESTGAPLSLVEPLEGLLGCMIPVGGGKDSIVSLDILRDSQAENACFIINPRGATLETAKQAGFLESGVVGVWRTLDQNMLQLNREGFLNGHTPFSALVAFSSVLAAAISGKRYVVLSNESSANESTVAGSDVNHQYSKSFAFEDDFSKYVRQYIGGGIEYFSLLRPWSEFQIACYFAKLKSFHSIFRSCNVGSKTDSWCADCSKCLFVSIILSPFLTDQELLEVFGSEMLQKVQLQPIFDQLTGMTEEKPFECVGSVEEINAAACLAIQKREQAGKPLPALYAAYRKTTHYLENLRKAEQLYTYFNEENLLPPLFLEKMKQKTAKLREIE